MTQIRRLRVRVEERELMSGLLGGVSAKARLEGALQSITGQAYGRRSNGEHPLGSV
jgi:hypothetical protein